MSGYTPKIAEERVVTATGSGWARWFAHLKRWGAVAKGHRETARYLAKERGLSPWWSQMVTVEFERFAGVRKVGQKSSGSYSVTAQRTFQGTIREARLTLSEALEGVAIETLRDERGAWEFRPQSGKLIKGSRVEVAFGSSPAGRATVRIEHHGLKTAAQFERLRLWWRSTLRSL